MITLAWWVLVILSVLAVACGLAAGIMALAAYMNGVM